VSRHAVSFLSPRATPQAQGRDEEKREEQAEVRVASAFAAAAAVVDGLFSIFGVVDWI
jgi:hypothetical protein